MSHKRQDVPALLTGVGATILRRLDEEVSLSKSETLLFFSTVNTSFVPYLEVFKFFQHLLSINERHWHLLGGNFILSVVQPEMRQ